MQIPERAHQSVPLERIFLSIETGQEGGCFLGSLADARLEDNLSIKQILELLARMSEAEAVRYDAEAIIVNKRGKGTFENRRAHNLRDLANTLRTL